MDRATAAIPLSYRRELRAAATRCLRVRIGFKGTQYQEGSNAKSGVGTMMNGDPVSPNVRDPDTTGEGAEDAAGIAGFLGGQR